MSNAIIAYSNSKGIIKSVTVDSSGAIDELGVQLLENFKTNTDAKELIVSSIDYIEDGEVQYMEDIDEIAESYYEFCEYDSKEEFIQDMPDDCPYYLFENNMWYVCKAGFDELKELEVIIDEEY